MIITGIGSRKTPSIVLTQMRNLAEYWSAKGAIFRSGKAGGADEAFQLGAQRSPKSRFEAYIPWAGFTSNPELYNHWDIVGGSDPDAERIAQSIHPAWHNCSQGARKLHTRNVMQILGQDLQTPSDVVLFWCPLTSSGRPTGGTATAVNLAESRGIPCIHLDDPLVNQKLLEIYEQSNKDPKYFNDDLFI